MCMLSSKAMSRPHALFELQILLVIIIINTIIEVSCTLQREGDAYWGQSQKHSHVLAQHNFL